MKTYAYGFPRLGKNREFKRLVEEVWNKSISQDDLMSGLDAIQDENNTCYQQMVDVFPDGEMTLYDPMLDVAILCGLFDPKDVTEYYALCRGASALEMSKWFNTNYHYLITDFTEIKNHRFYFNRDHFVLRWKNKTLPSLIGPFTFLKLSKGLNKDEVSEKFFALIDVYKEIIEQTDKIQIEEPAFVLDLTSDEIAMIEDGYRRLKTDRCWISLITYYDAVDWLDVLLTLPVDAIGLDFVRGYKNHRQIVEYGFPNDKALIAGLIDGRNVWRSDINQSLAMIGSLNQKIENLFISNAAPLYHLPVSLAGEKALDERLKNRLCFAQEKLEELHLVAKCFDGLNDVPKIEYSNYGSNPLVQDQIRSLKPDDFVKPVSLEERRKIHDEILGYALFPTTTIGSFPQTAEVRKKRAEFRTGKLSSKQYDQYVQAEIDQLIQFQEDLGLDVLVHGEFERTDMVEFFAQNLSGVATTQAGWIISYGTRVYRPPIIFGDVSRPKPMTVKEIAYAQAQTQKPVKGMLTGPVTIIAWSFCREDIHVSEVAYQIALSLRAEINDYEKAGIKIVQVDEAAFREKAPIKKRDWPNYFEWAVKSFNLTTNTEVTTQIHTHMCYSEFGEIIEYINQMDFDVISIEASRSRGDIIDYFDKIDFKRQIGLGVWDIHSPSVPSTEKMIGIVKRSLNKIPKVNFWLNPDCGLKTRQWDEVEKALGNMVFAAEELRQELT